MPALEERLLLPEPPLPFEHPLGRFAYKTKDTFRQIVEWTLQRVLAGKPIYQEIELGMTWRTQLYKELRRPIRACKGKRVGVRMGGSYSRRLGVWRDEQSIEKGIGRFNDHFWREVFICDAKPITGDDLKVYCILYESYNMDMIRLEDGRFVSDLLDAFCEKHGYSYALDKSWALRGTNSVVTELVIPMSS